MTHCETFPFLEINAALVHQKLNAKQYSFGELNSALQVLDNKFPLHFGLFLTLLFLAITHKFGESY
jgi:hypothetical protein